MASPPEPPHINTYNLSNANSSTPAIHAALSHLRNAKYFKTALTLYRRLQFGRFLPASHLLTNLDLSAPNFTLADDEPWCYAFVDRSCRPETEVWFFGSWEVDDKNKWTDAPTAGAFPDAPEDEAIEALLKSLILTIDSLGIPQSLHQDVLDAKEAELAQQNSIRSSFATAAQTNGIQTSNPESKHAVPSDLERRTALGLNPQNMLWGAIHAATVPHLQRLGVLRGELVANHLFLFDVDAISATEQQLPEGLRWERLEARHFDLVKTRTSIARQSRTLAVLPNLAIFPAQPADADPVAWAFIGLDSSLTTLHTEPDYRRKGLAGMLTSKLFREGMDRFWEEDQKEMSKWAHGVVVEGNEASMGMCRKLGGEERKGMIYWLRIDLDKLRRV